MRVGPHTNDNPAHNAAFNYIERVRPNFAKWLSPDARLIRECRRVSPGTRHIGRTVQDQSDYGRYQAGVLSHAREFVGVVDYWEGANEHIGDQAPERVIRAFASDEVGLARRLNEIGMGAMIGGFSTGTLDDGKFNAFEAAFQYMSAVGPGKCMLHFHEYAAAYMGFCVKTPDGKNQHPDGGSFTGISTNPAVWQDPTLRGWLVLRYRDLLPLLAARGWAGVRAVISEGGIDNTTKDPRPHAKGWKDSRGTQFENIPGLGDYAGQLRWWAWQMSHDPFIAGAVDFGWGARDWESFRLDNEPAMLERVIAGQLTVPVGAIGSAPAPQPSPRPTPAPTLRPRVTAAVEVRCIVAAGEGAAAYAGRAAGWPEATFGQRSAWAREIAAANNLETPAFRAGIAYRLPDTWFAVKEA